MIRSVPIKFLLGFVALLLPLSRGQAQPLPEIQIGVLAELSGQFQSIGDECRHGYQVALAGLAPDGLINGRAVKLIFGDHQREAKTGMTEFNRLTGEAGALGMASNASSVVMALNPISQGRKIPLFGVSAHPDFTKNNSYGFRAWLNANVEGAALARAAFEAGHRKFALLTLEDDYPLAVSKGYVAELKRLGGRLVFEDQILKSEFDFVTIAARIRTLEPDAVFVNVVGDQLPLILKKFREQGLKQRIYSTFSLNKREYLTAAGHKNVESVIFLEINGRKPNFSAKLAELFGTTLPTGLTYACYTAVGLPLEAIRKNPEIGNSEELYTALLKLSEIDLLDGPVKVLDREIQFDYALRIVRSGKIEDLPSSAAHLQP